MNKTNPVGDFLTIRREAQHFRSIVSTLAHNPNNRALSWLALDVGKSLAWWGCLVDRHSTPLIPEKGLALMTVNAIGHEIRLAALASLEGRDIGLSAREVIKSQQSLQSQLDRIEAMLKGGAN